MMNTMILKEEILTDKELGYVSGGGLVETAIVIADSLNSDNATTMRKPAATVSLFN